MADLQLDVKGCRDVYASFDKYVEVERLEGDNKYHAEEHGLQVSCFMSDLLCFSIVTYEQTRTHGEECEQRGASISIKLLA